jgi:hypothetical protein
MLKKFGTSVLLYLTEGKHRISNMEMFVAEKPIYETEINGRNLFTVYEIEIIFCILYFLYNIIYILQIVVFKWEPSLSTYYASYNIYKVATWFKMDW